MRRFWGRLALRHKITAVMVLTIVLVILTLIPVSAKLIRNSLLAQQQRHLANVRNLTANLLADYLARITDYVTLFSKDRDLQITLFYHTELAGEREHPLRAANRLYHSFKLGFLEVGDRHGRVVAAGSEPLRFDEDRRSDPVVAGALQGRVSSGLEATAAGFVIKAAAPLYYDENQLIGFISAGIILDQASLAELKELSGMEIVLLDTEQRVVVATLPAAVGVIPTLLPVDELLLGGRQYLVSSHVLADIDDRPAGHLMLLQQNQLPAVLFRIHATMVTLILAVLAVSLALLFVILKRLTRPIVHLREGAERIGRGDFSHRIAASGEDELGHLSGAFNRMAANLERLRSVEEQLARAKRLADVGEFAAGVAHEINNPIGNVLGIAKLLRRSVPEEDERAPDVETIVREADRCGRIVQDLLSYARQAPPRLEPTDPARLIDETVAALSQAGWGTNIVISRQYGRDLPEVALDPLQIGQVLRNILLNAAQAIGLAGTITIRVGPVADERIEIAIADTGSGIEEQVIDRIFHPFFTTKGSGRGTGLGLALSYNIVHNHGGEIEVTSTVGRGSVFRVLLPLRREQARSPQAAGPRDRILKEESGA